MHDLEVSNGNGKCLESPTSPTSKVHLLNTMTCNGDDKDWSTRWKECFLHELTARPKHMTEVRRDGKDDAIIAKVIAAEMERRLGLDERKKVKFEAGMRDYAAACWQTC